MIAVETAVQVDGSGVLANDALRDPEADHVIHVVVSDIRFTVDILSNVAPPAHGGFSMDRYTNLVLTVIAVFLAVTAFEPINRPNVVSAAANNIPVNYEIINIRTFTNSEAVLNRELSRGYQYVGLLDQSQGTVVFAKY